jgi:type IV secretion system protein VirB10
MKAFGMDTAIDPREGLSSADLKAASARAEPEIPRRSKSAETLGVAVGVLVVAAMGAVTLAGLSHNRQARHIPAPTAAIETPPPQTTVIAPASPPPPSIVAQVQQGPAPIVTALAAPSPLLVLDQTAPSPASPEQTGRQGSGSSSGAAVFPKNAVYFTPDEQFAGRAADQGVPTSTASRLSNASQMVAQGTVIAAVLETAVNSDLPGYARAIVSQDVRSFDRKTVVIPRGSRLVGEYKSAASIGQSRAFIVWTRVLRPDGVSVQLGSPTTDELGQAGLSGKVDRHFWQRYGGAVLMTTIGGAASSIGGGSTVVLGGTTDASGAATSLQSSGKISPTIRVPQGTPIQVFVAKDLDFSDAAS